MCDKNESDKTILKYLNNISEKHVLILFYFSIAMNDVEMGT